MQNYFNIIEPSFIINKQKCLNNIQKMVEKAKKYNLVFRPHFKTHQSIEVGQWFRQKGVEKITVSSLAMAEYFAKNGWKDITIALPMNMLEIRQINKLAGNIQLNILLDSVEVARVLRDEIINNSGYFIEIDTGYHRTGIDILNKKKIDTILSKLAENEKAIFKGFLTHSGNTYNASSVDEIQSIQLQTLSQLNRLKDHYSKYFKDLMLSIGDTPGCSLSENFDGIDEIRPGNFVFYDWMQHEIGSCSFDEIAVTMICPVVGKYPERNEIAIHGGAVHFSKDYILNKDGSMNYGQVNQRIPSFEKMESLHLEKAIENCYLSSISQEHGIVKCTDKFIEQTQIGDLVTIIPIHSCLTMNLMKNNFIII